MLRTVESAKPVASADVDAIESRLGHALPADYREFLLASNGGRPERDLVNIPECKGSPEARIHFFFGIDHAMQGYDLAWNLAHADDLPPGLMPIATTEGADMFCMTPSGGIVFWDGYGGPVIPLADSFVRFVARLYRDDLSPDLSRFGES